jgi:thiamine-monophosphate kinase
MLKEDQIVSKITRMLPSISAQHPLRGVRVGIGDDAAILPPNPHSDWVLSTDAFLERVHFLPGVHPPHSVGYKSLVRATSDLVAMGATPKYFLLTLALPVSQTETWLDHFLAGMARAARSLKMRLIGGDTSQSPSTSISITVIGDAAHGRALTRSGAKPGDLIYVTGRLGRAQLGLALILDGLSRRPAFRPLLRPHLYPQIRVKLGEWLARKKIPSAMMDISDGLSTDLARLCAASRVGARIDAARIPRVAIPASLSALTKKLHLDPLQMALHGGDDYGLLFTAPPREAKLLRRAPRFADITAIGEITRAKQILLRAPDGSHSPLFLLGWDSFRHK